MRKATRGQDDARGLSERFSRTFLTLAAIVLSSLGAAIVTLVLVLASFGPHLDRLIDGRGGITVAHAGMLDQETGLRAYLETRNGIFLEPYVSGQSELIQGNQTVATDLADDATLAPLVLNMRLAQQQWISGWATSAAAIGQGDVMSSQQLTSTLEHGKVLFDAYRVTEDRLSAATTAEIIDAEDSQRTVVTIGLALALVVLAVGVIIALRQARGLRRAVIGPVNDLLETMTRVRSGDVDARPRGGGPRELRTVGEHLSRMIDELLRARAVSGELAERAGEQAARLRVILSLARDIAGSLSLRYVVRAVGTSSVAVSGFPRATVWLLDPAGRTLMPLHESTATGSDLSAGAAVELGEGAVGRAAAKGSAVAGDHGDDLTFDSEGGEAVTTLAVPMVVGARVVGVIELTAAKPVRLTRDVLDVIESLAGQAASAIEAARLHQQTEELSLTDALTHLPNRRRLDDDLAAEGARSRRYQRPLSFLMLDVDHFKRFNDTHGHQAGDTVLQELATALSDSLRETDTAYRYGGEEFAILLRETDRAAAEQVAERIRNRIQKRFAARVGIGSITASLGVASMPDDATTDTQLVAAADRALYVAKRAGRNRVSVLETAVATGS
ncbi:MAG: diguanylate cyclase [Candidatus Dormibacteraeota bacterium]|nr:diguanylate cyclase [Candidatus Dormibacteraeota bacterium]MBV9525067.1 diguanylate cyclase [Candidatus Dormibacteraeota bacterium]